VIAKKPLVMLRLAQPVVRDKKNPNSTANQGKDTVLRLNSP
jgi:hypothetical protein